MRSPDVRIMEEREKRRRSCRRGGRELGFKGSEHFQQKHGNFCRIAEIYGNPDTADI